MNDTILSLVKEKFPRHFVDSIIQWDQLTILLKPEGLLEVVENLKNDPAFGYDFLQDLCGADYPQREQRFEMIYQLYSRKHNHRIRIKVSLQGKNPTIDSLTGLFAAANWPERETYDMYGIKFRNHPNLKRILLFEEFKGFPLRKDFPIEGRDRGTFPKGTVMNNKVVNTAELIKEG